MPRRVIIGKHPNKNEYGMWVSKPGFDAADLNVDNLLLDTSSFNSRPVFSGSVSNVTLRKNTTKSNQKSDQYSWSDPGDGSICYDYEIPFGFDLGYTPACFITFNSTGGGGPYPRVLVKSDRLVLEYWHAQGYYPATYNQFFGFQYLYKTPNDLYTFDVTVYYTVFQQSINDTFPIGGATGVPRVIISPTRMKASRKGFDVTTATRTQTAFEVDFTKPAQDQLKYSGIFLKGTARTDTGPWQVSRITVPFANGVQYVDRKFLTIPLGKTFAKPPQFLYALRNLNNTAAGAHQRYSAIRGVTNGTIGTVVWASSSTTELTLRVEYDTFGTPVGSRDWEFSYVVFQA